MFVYAIQGVPLYKNAIEKYLVGHKKGKKKNNNKTEITYKLSCYEYLFTFVNFP